MLLGIQGTANPFISADKLNEFLIFRYVFISVIYLVMCYIDESAF